MLVFKKSKKTKKLFCVPGNAGISEIATCKNINPNDKKDLLKFCKEKKIELVVIGPEEYLANGLSDFLIKNKISTFGPGKKAAKLESSKFFKKFLIKHKIPTLTTKNLYRFLRQKIFKKCKFP